MTYENYIDRLKKGFLKIPVIYLKTGFVIQRDMKKVVKFKKNSIDIFKMKILVFYKLFNTNLVTLSFFVPYSEMLQNYNRLRFVTYVPKHIG